jgi:hypothetical protein
LRDQRSRKTNKREGKRGFVQIIGKVSSLVLKRQIEEMKGI